MNITLSKNRERGSLILAVFVVIIVLVVASYVIAFMRKETKIIDTKMKQQATNDDAITVPTYSNNFVYSAVTNRVSAVVIADSIRPVVTSKSVAFGQPGSNAIHPVIIMTFVTNGLYLCMSNDSGWANTKASLLSNATNDLSAAIPVEMWRSSNNADWEDLGSIPALTNQPNMFIDLNPYPNACFYRASYSAW